MGDLSIALLGDFAEFTELRTGSEFGCRTFEGMRLRIKVCESREFKMASAIPHVQNYPRVITTLKSKFGMVGKNEAMNFLQKSDSGIGDRI